MKYPNKLSYTSSKIELSNSTKPGFVLMHIQKLYALSSKRVKALRKTHLYDKFYYCLDDKHAQLACIHCANHVKHVLPITVNPCMDNAQAAVEKAMGKIKVRTSGECVPVVTLSPDS